MEQCVAGGAAEAVEQCVLRMDILSLDLNQASLFGCEGRWRVRSKGGQPGFSEPGPEPDEPFQLRGSV